MTIYVMLLDLHKTGKFERILTCERFGELQPPKIISDITKIPGRNCLLAAYVPLDKPLYIIDPDPIYLGKVNKPLPGPLYKGEVSFIISYPWKLVPIEEYFTPEDVEKARLHCLNAHLEQLNT